MPDYTHTRDSQFVCSSRSGRKICQIHYLRWFASGAIFSTKSMNANHYKLVPSNNKVIIK